MNSKEYKPVLAVLKPYFICSASGDGKSESLCNPLYTPAAISPPRMEISSKSFENQSFQQLAQGQKNVLGLKTRDVEGEHEQRPEVKIKAMAELHAIEVTLFTMWKSATKSLCK